MWERTDVLCLGWWANGGPLLSRSGVRAMIEGLAEVLPEAVPSRWDVDETYRYRMVDEGLEGLVDFVDAHRGDVLLRAKAPARRIDLYAVPPSKRDGEFRATCLQVELDVSALDRKGPSERLPDAFEALGALIDPFYAEARIMRGVAKHEGSPLFDPEVELYPFRWNAWWGLPVRGPFAAMLGRPYRQLWPDFGANESAGLAVESPRSWHRALEPLSWSAPTELCQVFDPYWAELAPPPWDPSQRGFQLTNPTVRPALWPFGQPEESVSHAPAEWQSVTGDGRIRQVAVDDPDGEAFETWERIPAGYSDVLSVWAEKTSDSAWPWKITISALEFVRSEPLESRLRAALTTALGAVPAVTAVTEEDTEVYLVAGAPDGYAITKAATQAIDGLASEIIDHYDSP